MASFRISDEELARRESRFEAVRIEYQICKRKLDSKCEALLILSKELDQCRSERDQFKLMAEQLRERYQALKRQLMGKMPSLDANSDIRQVRQQDLGLVLIETREQNKSLQFEVEDLKQKLHDAQGDIKLLREQLARQRVGTTDEGMNTRHFPAHERENLVRQLEAAREKYTQSERDLQQVIDEKEELVTERDVYKNKYERLNQELNYILKGDEKRVVDIDALVMENKYLQDRLKQMEEEKSIAMATVSKYKNLLERKKIKSSLKLGQSRSGGLVITQKQVSQVLEDKAGMMPTPQAMADMQSLASALLETVNDKNLALSHQRKTNKILGNRVSELEKKIKTLEVAGLWNIPSGNASSLEKLKAECEEVKTLMPQYSQSSENIHADEDDEEEKTAKQEFLDDLEAEFCSPSTESSTTTSPAHSGTTDPQDDRASASYLHSLDMSPTHKPTNRQRGRERDVEADTIAKSNGPSALDSSPQDQRVPPLSPTSEYNAYVMEDLDLLPTKEELVKCVEDISITNTAAGGKSEYLEKEHLQKPVHVSQGLSHDESISHDSELTNEDEADSDLDTETARRLGHLVENMTTKMVECSHRAHDKSPADQSDSGVYIQSGVSETDDSRCSTPTDDKPLLMSDSGNIQQAGLLGSEDTGNIEV